MKTITLKNVDVQEIIVRPNDNLMTIQYNLLDDTGAYVSSRVKSFKDDELPNQSLATLSSLITKLLGGLETDEGLEKAAQVEEQIL